MEDQTNHSQILELEALSKTLSAKLRLSELNRLLKVRAGFEIKKVKGGELEIQLNVTSHNHLEYEGKEYLRGSNEHVKFVITKDEERTIVFQELC